MTNIIRTKTVVARECRYRGKGNPLVCNNPYYMGDHFVFEKNGIRYCNRKDNQFCNRPESEGFMERVTKNMENVIGDEESLLLS